MPGLTASRAFPKAERLFGINRFIPIPEFEQILIFYKPLPDRVEIVRILHGARDIEGAFS